MIPIVIFITLPLSAISKTYNINRDDKNSVFSMFNVTVKRPIGPAIMNNSDWTVFHEATSFATHVIDCASHLPILYFK